MFMKSKSSTIGERISSRKCSVQTKQSPRLKVLKTEKTIQDNVCPNESNIDRLAIPIEKTSEMNISKESPKLATRRKMLFDKKETFSVRNMNGDQEIPPEELEEEAQIPRRKKLRSEVTEDELWEGFPQNVRFKRLTPQKCLQTKSPDMQLIINNKIEESKHIRCGNEDLKEKYTVDEDILSRPETRTVENIFSDFSKVVRQEYHALVERMSKTETNAAIITPTRSSARLQEKRESPLVRKDDDFVYSPLRKEDSKHSMSIKKSHKNQESCPEKQSTDCVKVYNETMKLLYKDSISKRHGDLNSKGQGDKVSTKRKLDFLETIDKEHTLDNAQQEHKTQEPEEHKLRDAAQEKDETLITDCLDETDLESDGPDEDVSMTPNGIEQDFNNLKIYNDTDLTDERIEMKVSQKLILDNNTFDDSDSTRTSSEIQHKNSSLKLRIRKLENGTATIQPISNEDHAYVLSNPKPENCRKATKKNSTSQKRKRLLPSDMDGDDSLAKRRSPRVANASSVGKGPGMIDLNSSPEKFGRESTEPRSYCRKKRLPSTEEQLLKNPRLEKYACMLWSSEQRRHFQQREPGISLAALDELMRKAWNDLEKKDKIRYFTRASNATRDENKHSSSFKQILDLEFPEDDEENQLSPEMGAFLSLSSSQQDEKLKKWLKFFYEVSPTEYAKLKTLEKPKQKKEELKSNENNNPLQYYRKILFQSILYSKDRIFEIYQRKKRKQQDMVKEAFGTIVERLINGKTPDDLKFSRDVVSKQLAEVLLDLQFLENERKVGVCGAPLTSKSYENVLENLKGDVAQETADDEVEKRDDNVALPENEEETENKFSQELLEKAADSDLPLLEAESISEILESFDKENGQEIFSRDILEQLSTIFEQQAKKEIVIDEDHPENNEVRNPANILTSWVLADQFKAMARSYDLRPYNSMYSLIERKNLLPYLQARAMAIRNVQSGLENNLNNSSKTGLVQQSKIDDTTKLKSANSPQVVKTVSSPSQSLRVPQIRPAIQMANPHNVVSRAPTGHTLVRFSSESGGRYRIFSVRQTQ